MRRGQRAGAAAEIVTDDVGRVLVTGRYAAIIECRHLNVIRRAADPVACDVKTGALLWDAIELGERLRSVPRTAKRQT